MIYEYPSPDDPIRQGDIFVGLPRVDVTLGKLIVLGADGEAESAWEDLAKNGKQIEAVFPVRPVAGIVITQDCDAIRNTEISLCEVRAFREVDGKAMQTKDAKGWVSILTQHARINLKWFYLPPDARLGFTDKMAADFGITLRVPRVELEGFRRQRMGRLNPLADEHFRERLAEYYRRYPYDEWYSFNDEELAEYRKKNPDAAAFPWQSKESSR